MSGSACSFWQKVLMAALSKVLVQVTEQSILRWMREKGNEKGWERETERGKSSALSGTSYAFGNSSSTITGFSNGICIYWYSALIIVSHATGPQRCASTENVEHCILWLAGYLLTKRTQSTLSFLAAWFPLPSPKDLSFFLSNHWCYVCKKCCTVEE